ncbi:hypothetical protein [Streptantibioticus silvisoli]|uniref:Nucleotidyltransferase domain-containing protein n=1 Tax=Streptantibioticus silvisoli TaxID=2705255 RepID=A0ABT6VUL5_9ACTN|nr:hypothetical protein [Streptantibioticus silvisoli]MDI5962176.1 hypothetical protein [Streptantibioticus silvisoli]
MRFELPTMALRFGSGSEATPERRRDLEAGRREPAAVPDGAEIAARYPIFADAVSVYAAGSVVQGWGHANSDLDLYVITDEPIDLTDSGLEYFDRRVSTEDPDIRIVLGEFGPFRADIELWRAAQVDEIIARFAGSTPSQEAPEPGKTEQDLLYRLASGMPLTGADWWQRRRDEINASCYGGWLAENRKLTAETLLEDVGGLLVSGDEQTAVLAARDALVASVEALLAVHRDYSINRKWLYRRLLAVRPPEISVEAAWRALTMVGAADDPAGWAGATAALSQRLLITVEGAKRHG